MTNVRAVEARRAISVSCPRCLSLRVVESRRNPLEGAIYFLSGYMPCRCTSCMGRFSAFVGPAWLRAFFGKPADHSA